VRSFEEVIRDAVAHLTRKTRFFGFYPYKVLEDATGRPTLQAVGLVDGLPSEVFPDQRYLDKAHGLPGVTSTLVKDAIVLVGFKGGDPGSPFVAFYLPGQAAPGTLALAAATSISADAPTITLGGTGAKKAANGEQTDANLGALWGAINTLRAIHSLPTLASMPTVQASKVMVE
jgi:hypothetical protein